MRLTTSSKRVWDSQQTMTTPGRTGGLAGRGSAAPAGPYGPAAGPNAGQPGAAIPDSHPSISQAHGHAPHSRSAHLKLTFYKPTCALSFCSFHDRPRVVGAASQRQHKLLHWESCHKKVLARPQIGPNQTDRLAGHARTGPPG